MPARSVWNDEPAPAQFGAGQHGVPRPRQVTFHDKVQELNKLELKSDAGSWLIWLDDQFKVLRISIPSEKTEVVRD